MPNEDNAVEALDFNFEMLDEQVASSLLPNCQYPGCSSPGCGSCNIVDLPDVTE